ncbi:hypothetical protein Tco_0414507 [Tanacetum coccineum]
MNIYNMKLEQFQVNTKFLNTLPPEWSKFVTGVKLVRDFHTTNIDQLHAYLGQHEFHANEVRLMHECNSDPRLLWCNPSADLATYPTHHRTSYFKLKFTPLKFYLSVSPHNALAKVNNYDNNMINQVVQAMLSSEQSSVMNHSETEITSDSNIIPYFQYVKESQQAAVQRILISFLQQQVCTEYFL